MGGAALVLSLRPVEVEVVYDLSERPPLREMSVRFLHGGEEARRSEFRAPGDRPRHMVKLRPGEYTLSYRMVTQDGATIAASGALTVDRESGGAIVRP